MQQTPTLTGVRLRTVGDALKVFHAVASGALPMIVRRLDFEERKAIQSGNIYVWEERNASTTRTGLGIERWTDGHQYTPSRVRDDFLLYVCKDVDPAVAGQALNSAQIEAHRLIKQTYSVFVDYQGPRKKWHITAYYTPATLNRLRTIDSIPLLYSIVVPPNVYAPARATKHMKGKSIDNDGNAMTALPSSISQSRRASLASTPSFEGGMVSRGQSQATGSSRSRYPYDGPPGAEGSLSQSSIYAPSSSSGHPAAHIPRPSTAMSPSPHQAMAPSPIPQEYRTARLPANTRRRSSISQPYPYAAAPEASSLLAQEWRPSTPSQAASGAGGQRSYAPPTMVPLSLLEQTQSRQVGYRSPIDDSVLKRLPPSTQ